MNWSKYYKNKNISKRYKAQILKRMTELFKKDGSIEVKDFCELSWLLGIDYENRLSKAIDELEHEQKIACIYRLNRYIIDVIPF